MGNCFITRRTSEGARIAYENYTPKKGVYGGGVTRTFAQELSSARSLIGAGTVGDYALFIAGQHQSEYLNVVDVYDRNLRRVAQAQLSQGRTGVYAASGPDFAIMAGGVSEGIFDAAESISGDLTVSLVDSLSEARYYIPCLYNQGSYLFVGGNISGTDYSAAIDVYNDDLVHSLGEPLETGMGLMGCAGVGGYALFAGGTIKNISSGQTTAMAINKDLVRSVLTPLFTKGNNTAGAAVGGYALFCGATSDPAVTGYNEDLVAISPPPLSVSRVGMKGAGNGAFAIFSGGTTSGATMAVDSYDQDLLHSAEEPLLQNTSTHGAAALEDVILVGGGRLGGSFQLDTVYAYSQNRFYDMELPQGTGYDFGEGLQAHPGGVLQVKVPVNGYILYREGVMRNG